MSQSVHVLRERTALPRPMPPTPKTSLLPALDRDRAQPAMRMDSVQANRNAAGAASFLFRAPRFFQRSRQASGASVSGPSRHVRCKMAAAISNAVSEYANISALLDQNARGEFPTKLLK